MLTGLREAKLNEIDEDARRRKAAAEYIITCIERDESLFREAFLGDDQSDQPAADNTLYNRVTETVHALTDEYVRAFGVTVYKLRPGSQEMPAAKVGWATYEPFISDPDAERPDDKEISHTLRLTDAGVHVINGLREVLGLPTLEDQQQNNQAAWRSAMDIPPAGSGSSS